MEQTIRLLFVLLLIIFPFGQILRFEIGGGVAILAIDAVVGALSIVYILANTSKLKLLREDKLVLPIGFFIIACILSLVLRVGTLSPPQFFISFLYLVRWIAYAGLYFVVSSFPESTKQRISFWLLLAGMTTVIIGFIQYVLYPDLRNLFYAGWDEHLYRMFSTFFDPNFAGGIFVLTFLLGVSLLLGHSLKRDTVVKLTVWFAVATSFVALLFTYSRGSYLGFIAGLITLLFLKKQRQLVLGMLLMFAVGMIFLPKDMSGEGVRLLRTASIEARLEEASKAITVIRENPIFGVGFNAYRYARERHGYVTVNEFGDIHSAAGTDNSFLFVMATVGIIGFAAYIFLWSQVIRYHAYDSLLIASIITIFVHALFVNSLFYPHIMAWLWILIGTAKVRR